MNKDDKLLAIWLASATVWSILVFSIFSYIVFWRGHSGWWFLFGVLLVSDSSLYRALRRRFAIPDEDES